MTRVGLCATRQRLARCWLTLSALLVSANLCVEARETKPIHRVGYLSTATPEADLADRQAFLEAMRKLGYREGSDVTVIFRYAEGKMDQLPVLARGLVGAKVDLAVAVGTRAAVAVGNATRTIPIVMISSDPLASGLIETLSRPARNVTGLSLMFQELAGKRLGLLRETFPKIRRLGALWNALDTARFHAAEKAAQRMGFHVMPFEIGQPGDLHAAFDQMTSGRAEGLFTFTSALLTANRKTIVLTAAKSRLPGMYHNHAFVEDGGLMSYAPDMRESFRRAAVYVDKILKGARPGDLPVEQPMKFELVVNLKAANQIGKRIPSPVLARADRIIN